MSDDEQQPCRRCDADPGQPHLHLDDDCQLPHSHKGRRHPPRRSIGFCCEGCISRHEEWVAEIVDLYATLATVIDPDEMPDQSSGEYQKPRKTPASPSPIRLGAWAMLTGRLNFKIRDETDPTILHDAYLGAHLPHVPTILAAWAQAVYDANEWGTAPTDASGAGAVLRAHRQVLALLPDVDTYDAELRWVRRALRQAHGISDPTPLFDCISVGCGGHVWQQAAGSPRCDRCGRQYDRLDIVRARGAGLHERRRLYSDKTGNGHA